MAIIANLDILLGAKTDKLDKDLDKGKASVDGFAQRSLNELSGKITKVVGGLTVAAIATKGFTSAMELANKAVEIGVGLWQEWVSPQFEYVDALAKEARVLGLTVAQLQAYRNAGEKAGANADQLRDGLKTLNMELNELAMGSKSQVDRFARLGLAAEDFVGLSLDEKVRKVAEALAEIADPGQKAAIAARLFGEEAGMKMALLLGEGTGQIDAAAAALRSMGIALTDVEARRIEEANDRMAELKQTASGLGAVLAVEVAPAMGAFAETLGEMFVGEGSIGDNFRKIGRDIVDFAEQAIGALSQQAAFLSMVEWQLLRTLSGIAQIASTLTPDALGGNELEILAEELARSGREYQEQAARMMSNDWGKNFADAVNKNRLSAENAPGGSRDLLDSDAAKAAMEAELKIADSVAKTTERLQEQIDTFGMAASEIEAYKLAKMGASDADVAMVAALAAELEALKEAEKAASEVAKTHEKLKSTAAIVVEPELARLGAPAGALTRGSVAAFQATQQSARDSLLVELSKKAVEIATKQKEALDRIARSFATLGTLAIVE